MKQKNFRFILIIIIMFIGLPLKINAMTIFVNDLANNSTQFEVEPTDTVLSLKEQIRDMLLVELDDIILLHNGYELNENSLTMCECGIQNNAMLDLVFAPIVSSNNIFVIMPDETSSSFEFSLMDTVLGLKQKIKNQNGFSIDRQVLTYGGRTLDDNRLLIDYNVVSNASIVLNLLYDITIESTDNCSIVSDKIFAKKDDVISLSITPQNGYKVKNIIIINANNNANITNTVFDRTLLKITMPNNPIKIKVEVEEIQYNFDENSKNVTYNIGTDISLSLKITDTTIENFDKVYINNKELSSDNYTISTGSVILTLKASYLNNLINGTYSLELIAKDGGRATTTFTIINSQIGLEENPPTGDGIIKSILLSTISLIAIVGCGRFLNKKAIKN